MNLKEVLIYLNNGGLMRYDPDLGPSLVGPQRVQIDPCDLMELWIENRDNENVAFGIPSRVTNDPTNTGDMEEWEIEEWKIDNTVKERPVVNWLAVTDIAWITEVEDREITREDV